MPEIPPDSTAGAAQVPQSHEWTEDQLKAFINEVGAKVSGGERQQEKCRTVNSKVLIELVEKGVPGIIYTVQPDRHSPSRKVKFKTNVPFGWSFHSIGILKIKENQYLAFDQTNHQREEGISEFFFETGSLEKISQSLEERFGSIWDLAFGVDNPDIDSEITIHGKIEKVRQLIEKGKLKNPKIDDVTPETYDHLLAFEKKDLVKPLGLKFLPPADFEPDSPLWSRVRSRFTFKYA